MQQKWNDIWNDIMKLSPDKRDLSTIEGCLSTQEGLVCLNGYLKRKASNNLLLYRHLHGDYCLTISVYFNNPGMNHDISNIRFCTDAVIHGQSMLFQQPFAHINGINEAIEKLHEYERMLGCQQEETDHNWLERD
jgi:hypothetical protein